MPIENIRIRNFRSLRDLNVPASALTVLVGCNDEGKSNILRALDLFFNGAGASGYQLFWDQDYCGMAKSIKNKADQIQISITFTLPSSFKLPSTVVWTKTWRKPGLLHQDKIHLSNGKAMPARSKAEAFLRSIRFDYVPAIKGPEYFGRLLASVHDMLDLTVRDDIRKAAAGFTSEIKSHTKEILSEIEI